jgi:hypothetical protein
MQSKNTEPIHLKNTTPNDDPLLKRLPKLNAVI